LPTFLKNKKRLGNKKTLKNVKKRDQNKKRKNVFYISGFRGVKFPPVMPKINTAGEGGGQQLPRVVEQ